MYIYIYNESLWSLVMCMIFVQQKMGCRFARNTATHLLASTPLPKHRLASARYYWYQGATETGRIFVSDSEGYKFLPQLVDESARGNFESIGQFWDGARLGGILMDNRIIVYTLIFCHLISTPWHWRVITPSCIHRLGFYQAAGYLLQWLKTF